MDLFQTLMEIKEKMEDRGEQVPVGQVSRETLMKYKANNRVMDQLKDEMEIEQARLAKEMKRRLLDMFEDRVDEVQEEKAELWREIEAELGLTGDPDLTIDTKTGMVTQWVKNKDAHYEFRQRH